MDGGVSVKLDILPGELEKGAFLRIIR